MRMIGEVADLLGLETVKIFEKIILNKKVMAPFIQKDRGVTYISDEGIEQLKVLFHLIGEPKDSGKDDDQMEVGEHHLQEEILLLKEELEKKKKRVDTLDGEIERMDEMIGVYLTELSRLR